jgi:hypothetical protein
MHFSHLRQLHAKVMAPSNALQVGVLRGLLVVAIASAVALCACVMGGVVAVSNPSAPAGGTFALKDGVLRGPGLSVSVVPDNQVWYVGAIGILLPLIPLSVSTSPARSKRAFQVEVRFEPEREGYSFAPADVQLRHAGATVSAQKATALITRIFETHGEQRHVPGHRWACGRPLPAFEPVAATGRLPLQKGCVALEFETSTIEPAETFTIRLLGIYLDGEPVPLPDLSYARDTKGVFVLMSGT